MIDGLSGQNLTLSTGSSSEIIAVLTPWVGVLPTILGGGVPHGSQKPDPISDQNILFFIPLFRPDPENLYPISDLE